MRNEKRINNEIGGKVEAPCRRRRILRDQFVQPSWPFPEKGGEVCLGGGIWEVKRECLNVGVPFVQKEQRQGVFGFRLAQK